MAQLETHRIPPRNLAVREEIGFDGVREQQASRPELLTPNNALPQAPDQFPQFGGFLAREEGRQSLHETADAYQQGSTDRSWAPAPTYPFQRRLQELNREVVPKNHQEFELVGRNLGPHATANAVGGYAGRDEVGPDVTEKFTQRTFDDFKDYYHPTGAAKTERGTASVYNQFFQHRIDAREVQFKNTPGRFPGAFRHDIRRVGHAQDELQQRGQFVTNRLDGGEQVLKETMKRDDAMVYRQREDENPNREGLRMQYADVYSPEWNSLEQLDNARRKQHTVEREIDTSMLEPYFTNPYSQPLGIVPFSGQNNTDLNNPAWQAELSGQAPGQLPQ